MTLEIKQTWSSLFSLVHVEFKSTVGLKRDTFSLLSPCIEMINVDLTAQK